MRPRTTGSPDRPARPPAPPVFGEAELEGLPEPVRRYLRASIAPGTPLATSARLRMRGRIKVGRWLPFHARQVLAPGSGFEWTARAGGVLSGFDRYADGQGEMRWKLFGLLPVMRAAGPDVTRSAAGRAAAETIWLPTTLLPRFGIGWRALDDQHLAARRNVGDVGDVEIEAHYRVDADGHLTSMVFDRWGDPWRTGAWASTPSGARSPRTGPSPASPSPAPAASAGATTPTNGPPASSSATRSPHSTRWCDSDVGRWSAHAAEPTQQP